MKLEGIFSAIATPFDHQGNLYRAKVRYNMGQWNKTKLSGYVVCGSTGECVSLSNEEKSQLWEWVAEEAGSERILIAGTAAEGVRETVVLTNRAAEIGYQAALVRTPSYYKNLLDNPEAQALYFRAVADQARIPILIYNFPQLTGLDISAETVAALSHHPNVVGIKESSGNLAKVIRMIRLAKEDFRVLVGSAPTLYSTLTAGAAGAVLAFANVAPYAMITIWEAFRTRDHAAGLEWQNRIGEPERLVGTKYGIPGLKYAMDLKGYYGGPPRLPLSTPTPEAKREIEAAFQDISG